MLSSRAALRAFVSRDPCVVVIDWRRAVQRHQHRSAKLASAPITALGGCCFVVVVVVVFLCFFFVFFFGGGGGEGGSGRRRKRCASMSRVFARTERAGVLASDQNWCLVLNLS